MTRLESLFCVAILAFFPGFLHADPLNYWVVAASGTTNNFNAVIYTNGLFVAVGDAGTILTSPDGANWAAQASGTANKLAGIAYGAGQFVAVGPNDTVLASSDATNWTMHATGTNVNWNSVCFGNGNFAVLGKSPAGQNLVYVSPDSFSWAQSYFSWVNGVWPDYTILSSIVFGNGHFACLGTGTGGSQQSSYQVGEVLTSADATNWNVTLGGDVLSSVSGLGFANDRFAVSYYNGGTYEYLYTSVDGTNWSQTTAPDIASATCGGQDSQSNTIVAAVIQPNLFLSGNDQLGWTTHNMPAGAGNAITYGQNPAGTGVFVAVGTNIAYSVVYASAYVWTNTAGGNWSNPTNWNLHQVPGRSSTGGSPDDVQITVPGTYSVVLDEGASPSYWDVHSLTLGAGNGNGIQTLVVSNKILYANPLTVTAGGVLADSGSSFHVSAYVQSGGQVLSTNGTWFVGPLNISSGGQFSANGNYAYDTIHGNVSVGGGGLFLVTSGWTTLASDASLTVAANGELDIPGNGYFQLQGPLTNSGTVYLIGNSGSVSEISVYNDGTSNYRGGLWNLAGGIVHLNGVANGYSLIQTGYGANSYFINQGAVLGTTPTPSNQTIGVGRFDNSGGVVTNLVGTMNLSTFTNTLAGIFYATNGAAIQFSGGTASAPLRPTVPLALLGGGQFRFTSGWLDLTNDAIPNLQLNGGVLELESSFQGGIITNLALNGILLTNLTLPVANGVFAVTNSPIYGNCVVQNGGQLITAGNGGEPTFHGNLDVTAGGLLTAASGWLAIPADGALTVEAGGRADVFGSAYIDLAGPVTNAGTFNLFGNNGGVSEIYMRNDGSANYRGSIWNQPGGTVRLNGVANGYSLIQTGYGANTWFLNQGALIANPGSPACSVSVTAFDTGAGAVSNLVSGTTLNLASIANTLAGTFYATAGATITLSGGASTNFLTPGVPLTLAGAGRFQFISGWLDLTNDIIPNLQLNGGVLKLDSAFQAGAITNLALNGITLTNLALPVTNGVLAVTNGVIYGNCVVRSGGHLIASGGSGPVTFHGSVVVDSGGLFTALPTWGAQIANDASLTVQASGEVDVPNAYLFLYGPLTNSGAVNLTGSGGAVSIVNLYNDGTANYRGGIWNLPGGTMNLNGVSNGRAEIDTSYGSSTYLVNAGTLNVNSQGIIRASSFTNAGAVTVLTGTLQLNDNNLVLQSTGSLNVRINSKTDYGKIAISGAVALTGALGATLNGVYVPTVGDSFTPLTYSGNSGGFTATNLPALVAWQTVYGATAVTLSVTQTGLIPEFTTAAWSGGDLVFNGTNGTPGARYFVLSATNIATPRTQWVPVATNYFDGSGRFSFTNIPDATRTLQFFMLELP